MFLQVASFSSSRCRTHPGTLRNKIVYPNSSAKLASIGWFGGAKVLGKLPVSGRPTNLDYSRAMAYCACRKCGWGCSDFLSSVISVFFLSFSFWKTTRYRLKYCLKGPLSLTAYQPTNQLASKHCYYVFDK